MIKKIISTIGLITLWLTLSAWSLFGLGSVVTQPTAEMIQEYKTDPVGAINKWILPQYKKNVYWGIQCHSDTELPKVESDIGEGFSHFCEVGGGVSVRTKTEYGHDFTCSSPHGEFIDKLQTHRYSDSTSNIRMVTVTLETAEARTGYEKFRTGNGPSGWVTTSDGRYRFVRIGTTEHRYPLYVHYKKMLDPSTMSTDSIRIDNIKSITYTTDIDAQIVREDGILVPASVSYFEDTVQDGQRINKFINSDSIFFVLTDTRTGYTYQKKFDKSNHEIKKIEIDDHSVWKNLPGGELFDGVEYVNIANGSTDINSLSEESLKDFIALYDNKPDPSNVLSTAKQRLEVIEDARKTSKVADVNISKIKPQAGDQSSAVSSGTGLKIGDQVCDYIMSDAKTTAGYSFGGKTQLVGFVEGVNQDNHRIQIRIAGINFSDGHGFTKSFESYEGYKGTRLLLNGIIWDNDQDWSSCS
ncbi:hypothetical protein [Ferrovum sp.]|uniref:hypothetical protein n=1 Tax=Ferrovum sp. TaxID=2609467 RepID=UPI0026268F2C|nr:hypothetical protein [Ferrovum sp.]